MIKDKKIQQDKLSFDISYVTDKGGRPVNEDSIAIAHTDENILISVADGLGAHGGGDIASKTAADYVKKEYMQIRKPNPKNIYNIFRDINDAILAKKTDEIKMKTTLACVLCRKKRMYISHVGDTRIYIFKNNRYPYVTVDHSVAYDEVMRAKGTLDDIRKNPNRHFLKSALGVVGMGPPDTLKQRIRPDISVLICSDGFWEYVNEEEMMESLANTGNSHDWLKTMLRYHSDKADIYNDNYSAICLRITKI